MAEDYLRKHMKLIADTFAGDIADENEYCSGTRCYDWRTGAPDNRHPWEYEHDLEEFLLTDPAAVSKQGLDALVLIGGIGTGKSTTLKRMIDAVRKPRICSAGRGSKGECHAPPIVIDLNIKDILGEDSKRGSANERIQSQFEDFWNTVATRFEQVLPRDLEFEREVEFWAWALEHPGVSEHSKQFHRWLNDVQHQVRAATGGAAYRAWSRDDLFAFLERRRSELMERLPDKDLVWYRVYELLFALARDHASACKCRFVFLDNVDQLEPPVQKEVVDFIILLSDVLRARTLIAIRPLTWDRSIHAHILVRTQNHFSPDLRDVLQARLRRLATNPNVPAEALPYLRRLVLTFTAPNSLWGDLFDATSGLSIRFAVRNFLNFIQSPLLPPLSEASDPFKRMLVSETARAFFFGEGENILHANLENLYALGTDMRHEYRLIKARILDYLVRVCDDGTAEIEQLAATITQFGYDAKVLTKALNDLLRSTRPLLWSQEGHQISHLNRRTNIAVTPIGRGYHSKLFGQLYYDEVCLARGRGDTVTIDRVLQFHRELWEQDQEEIKFAVRRHGPGLYRRLYPDVKPAISAIHALNLKEGVEKRDVRLPAGYDAQRIDFISAEVAKLLAPRW